MTILNLTQHVATPDQIAAGVVEPTAKKVVQELLTFASPPTATEIHDRAAKLAALAVGHGFHAGIRQDEFELRQS